MKKFFLLFFLLISNSYADEYHLIELDQVVVNYRSFFAGGHDPLITDNGLLNRDMDKELNLQVNTDIFHYFYWDNLIHSMTDIDTTNNHGQFRTIGLQLRLGLRLTDFIDIGYEHFSQHTLDYVLPYHFPLQDSIEVNIYLYRKDNHRESLF